MIDLHEGVRSIFDEAQRLAPVLTSEVFGRFDVGATRPAKKTAKTNHCTNCGRRGHLTRKCVNYEDWYEPPAWFKGAA